MIVRQTLCLPLLNTRWARCWLISYEYNIGIDMVVRYVQFCIVAHFVHPTIPDDEILGFTPPIAARSCLSGG